MADTISAYPLPKFHFQVQWGGTKVNFTEVTGLEVRADVIEYRDGASLEFHKIKMPGMQKFSNITLKRGKFQKDNDFYVWWTQISMNTVIRRDLIITLLNENHAPVFTWNVKNAFPVKVNAGDLGADKNEVMIETLELAHEGLTMTAN
jgi:phage tail-like protein